MNYTYIMKSIRKIVVLLNIYIISLLLFSCADLFHNAINTLEEISSQSDIRDPVRIFVGGDFNYMVDAYDRDAFIVLNGYGNRDDEFISKNWGIVRDYPSGSRYGVLQFEITDEFIYVGGNFMGYDTSNTNTADMDYKMVQRYFRDGSLDFSYKPFSAIPGNAEIYAIEILDNGSLVAGGDFGPYTAPGYSGETELINIDVDGNGSISSFPAGVDGSNFFSMEKIFENQLLIIGGIFSDFGGKSGFDNFTAVELGSFGVADSSGFSLIPDTNEIRDFTSFHNQLYVLGNHSNGVLYKYIYDGLNFIADTTFNTDFKSNLTDPLSFVSVHTLAVDKKGRTYIGGQFSNQEDVNGVMHNSIMRITTDGRIDPSFKVDIPGGEVFAIEIQANGKVLIGGSFSTVNGKSFNGLVRVTEYGGIDEYFDYSSFPGGIIYSFAIEEYS